MHKNQKAPTFVGASEIESELGNLTNNQTNPEGRARLTRRLIVNLVLMVIFEAEYSMCLPENAAKLLLADVEHTTHRQNKLVGF